MRFSTLVGACLLLLALVACGGGQPGVDSIALARDNGSGGAGDEVQTFKTADNPQHAIIRTSHVPSGTKVKIDWVAVDAGGEKNTTVVTKDYVLEGMENTVTISAELPGGVWPAGKYRVDAYVGDKLAKSKDFIVE